MHHDQSLRTMYSQNQTFIAQFQRTRLGVLNFKFCMEIYVGYFSLFAAFLKALNVLSCNSDSATNGCFNNSCICGKILWSNYCLFDAKIYYLFISQATCLLESAEMIADSQRRRVFRNTKSFLKTMSSCS